MGVVYFSIIPTFEPSRYCKCWIVCFYHTFKLDGDVSKGSIHVIVENENKETILDLTPEIKTGMLTVDEKCRYFLIL